MPRTFLIVLLLLLIAGPAAAGTTPGEVRVTPYGFVRTDVIHDNGAGVQGDWLLFARAGDDPRAGEKSLTMTGRHSRLGLKIAGPTVGTAAVRGLLEFDFAGGFVNSSTSQRQPQPRLRHAWVELEWSALALRMGQDWALVTFPLPRTCEFVAGGAKGNLWQRFPQIQLRTTGEKVRAALSLNRPMAGNVKYDDNAMGDFDFIGDGERTEIPWTMARVDVQAGPARLSAAGHFGKEDIFDKSGALHRKDTWSAVGGVVLDHGRVSVSGRAFLGENLNTFCGGVLQGFVAEDHAVRNVRAWGGWADLRLEVHEQWMVTVGAGRDDPRYEDLTDGMRSRNDWLWGNVLFRPDPRLDLGLELSDVKTRYRGRPDGEVTRVALVSTFRF